MGDYEFLKASLRSLDIYRSSSFLKHLLKPAGINTAHALQNLGGLASVW